MSKFRDLVESIIVGEEAPFWTFGEDTLEEATQISKLAKEVNYDIISKLLAAKYKAKIESDGEGHNPYKRDELSSYYYILKTKYPCKFNGDIVWMDIEVEYRVSTHDKPEGHKSKHPIDVYIPNKSFPKTWSKDGKVEEYDMSDGVRSKYKEQGTRDLIRKLNEKIDRYKAKLKQIQDTPAMLNDLLALPAQKAVEKYNLDEIYYKPWFSDLLKHEKEKRAALNQLQLSTAR